MATKTFEELKQLAIQIRDEKTNKQNTATRVGTAMLEHINKLEQDYYDKTTINNRTSEYNVSINHPTSGISSSNKYDLSSAIAQVPAELRTGGLTVSFLNSDGDTEKWEFGGGSWAVGGFSQVGSKILTELSENDINLTEQIEAVSLFDIPGWYTTNEIEIPSNFYIAGGYWKVDSNNKVYIAKSDGYSYSKPIKIPRGTILKYPNTLSTSVINMSLVDKDMNLLERNPYIVGYDNAYVCFSHINGNAIIDKISVPINTLLYDDARAKSIENLLFYKGYFRTTGEITSGGNIVRTDKIEVNQGDVFFIDGIAGVQNAIGIIKYKEDSIIETIATKEFNKELYTVEEGITHIGFSMYKAKNYSIPIVAKVTSENENYIEEIVNSEQSDVNITDIINWQYGSFSELTNIDNNYEPTDFKDGYTWNSNGDKTFVERSGYSALIEPIEVEEGDIIAFPFSLSSIAIPLAFNTRDEFVKSYSNSKYLIVEKGIKYIRVSAVGTISESVIVKITRFNKSGGRNLFDAVNLSLNNSNYIDKLYNIKKDIDFSNITLGYWGDNVTVRNTPDYCAVNPIIENIKSGSTLVITYYRGSVISTSVDPAYAAYKEDGSAYNDTDSVIRMGAGEKSSDDDGDDRYAFKISPIAKKIGVSYKVKDCKLKSIYLINGGDDEGFSDELKTFIQENSTGGDSQVLDDINSNYYLKGNANKSFTKTPCIIVAGQSNTDGRVSYDDLPEDVKSALPFNLCQSFRNSNDNTDNGFQPFTPKNSAGENKWAYDTIVFYNVSVKSNKNLYVIKVAVGATGIDPESGGGQWTADYDLYPEKGGLLKGLEQYIRKHYDPETMDIRAILWHQGEADMNAGERYYHNLKKVVAYLRGVIGNSRIPFILGTVSQKSGEYNRDVENAMIKLSNEDPYMHLIDMSGATLFDGIHFDATSSVYLGESMYDILIDLGIIGGNKINPSRPW